MLYDMKLNDQPFNRIKNGFKKIEMRLYDEKRELLRPRDVIRFTNNTTGEQISAEIVSLHIFSSFDELYRRFDKIELGYLPNETATHTDMEKYYTKDMQDKYGVVGIEIKLI